MVQNSDVALAPYQLKVFAARHARDVGAAVACGVNQVGGAKVAGGRMEYKAVGMLVDRVDRSAAPEFDAVRSGVLGGGDGDFKGVDVAGRGAPKRAGGFLARAGLVLPDLIVLYNAHVLDAVGASVFQQLFQVLAVGGGEAQHHGAGALKTKSKLFGPTAVEGAAACVNARLDGACCRIVSGVDKAAVCLCRAQRDVVARFHAGDRKVIS